MAISHDPARPKRLPLTDMGKRGTTKETGIVWQDGFFDYCPRNDAEIAETIEYIAKNPVRKGLCKATEEWPFRMTWR